ncbi:MAG: hypothetical protein ACI9N9_000934 [Enterobacterales bacterium]|jgi:hypothetical protein
MMNKLKFIAGALSLALMSTPLQAHDPAHERHNNNDKSTCNFDLEYDFAIKDFEITFSNDAGSKIFINQDNQLFVNGTQQALDGSQQQLVDNYADGVRDLVPEITTIAIEGVNLGVKAASMALSTLLGDGSPKFEHFTDKVEELAAAITLKLNSSSFNTKTIEESFDDDFGKEIEVVVQEAMAEITPIIMAQMVTAAMSGDDSSISELEMRAETLEHDIKNFVEPQAEALEARAKELCSSVVALDNIESEMVASGLEMMDLIGRGDNHNFNINVDKFNLDLGD